MKNICNIATNWGIIKPALEAKIRGENFQLENLIKSEITVVNPTCLIFQDDASLCGPASIFNVLLKLHDIRLKYPELTYYPERSLQVFYLRAYTKLIIEGKIKDHKEIIGMLYLNPIMGIRDNLEKDINITQFIKPERFKKLSSLVSEMLEAYQTNPALKEKYFTTEEELKTFLKEKDKSEENIKALFKTAKNTTFDDSNPEIVAQFNKFKEEQAQIQDNDLSPLKCLSKQIALARSLKPIPGYDTQVFNIYTNYPFASAAVNSSDLSHSTNNSTPTPRPDDSLPLTQIPNQADNTPAPSNSQKNSQKMGFWTLSLLFIGTTTLITLVSSAIIFFTQIMALTQISLGIIGAASCALSLITIYMISKTNNTKYTPSVDSSQQRTTQSTTIMPTENGNHWQKRVQIPRSGSREQTRK